MSMGHSNCTIYRNPGIKTLDVEAFIAAAKAAGTVETVTCAKVYEGDKDFWTFYAASSPGGAEGGQYDEDRGPKNPVYKEGQFFIDESL